MLHSGGCYYHRPDKIVHWAAVSKSALNYRPAIRTTAPVSAAPSTSTSSGRVLTAWCPGLRTTAPIGRCCRPARSRRGSAVRPWNEDGPRSASWAPRSLPDIVPTVSVVRCSERTGDERRGRQAAAWWTRATETSAHEVGRPVPMGGTYGGGLRGFGASATTCLPPLHTTPPPEGSKTGYRAGKMPS